MAHFTVGQISEPRFQPDTGAVWFSVALAGTGENGRIEVERTLVDTIDQPEWRARIAQTLNTLAEDLGVEKLVEILTSPGRELVEAEFDQ